MLQSITRRLARIGKFAKAAPSLVTLPNLVVLAIARDGPFGHGGALSVSAAKYFGVVKVRTHVTGKESAIINTSDMGQLISCEEVLIDKAYDLSLVPFQPDIIVDCGANIGLFTLIAGLQFPLAKLFAFEPNTSNFHMAEQQLARFAPRLSLVKAAVSTEEGEGWFFSEESNTGHLSSQGGEQRDRVRLINLIDEAKHWSGKKLLLKIDIEGLEREIIPKIVDTLPNKSAIFFEVHDGPKAYDELHEILFRVGFQVSVLRNRTPFFDCFALRT